MNREEFEILIKVIEEEGVRRDIGHIIDQRQVVSNPFWQSKLFYKTLLAITSIVAISSALIWLFKTNEHTSTSVKDINTLVENVERSNVPVLSEKTASNQNIADTFYNIEQTENNAIIIDGKEEVLKTSVLPENGSTPIEIKVGTEQDPVEEIKQQPTKIDGSKKEGLPSIKSSKDPIAGSSTDSSLQPNPSTVVDNSDSTSTQETANNSLKDGDTSASSSLDLSNVTKSYKWDFVSGIGYGFVSTGDIRCITLNNELNYTFSPRFSSSVHASFGKSYAGVGIVNASYISGGFLGYIHPWKSAKKNHLRIGVGPSLYTIAHTYRGSSHLVNGKVIWEYIFEKRRAFGYSIAIEDRYMINDKLFAGAKVYTNQFLNQDMISGANLIFGFKF